MRFLVFSDLHAHNYLEFSERLPGGITTRMSIILSVLKQIYTYAQKNNIKYVLFTGDLFHKRHHIEIPVFNVIYNFFNSSNVYGVRTIMIPGNHDFSTKAEDVHSIESFRHIKGIDVLGNEILELAGFDVVGTAMTNNTDALEKIVLSAKLKNPAILLIHALVTGSCASSGFKFFRGILSVSEINRKYIITLAGDNHLHQIKDNFVLVGSPLQHNFGDMGVTKGFLDVDISEKGIKNIILVKTKCPEFFIKTLDESLKGKGDDYNYYRIIIKQRLNYSEKERLDKLYKYYEVCYEASQTSSVNSKELLDKTVLVDKRQLFSSYIKDMSIELDKDKLLKMGARYILD